MFNKGELKLLWPFYLYYLIFGFSTMIVPFLIIYFRNIGLSFAQIGIASAMSSFAMVIFEVPTGAFADSYSRKLSVVTGFLIVSFSAFLIGFTTNFYLIALCWTVFGLGMTFVSGAEEAWVIDNLNHYKRKDLHHDYFIKVQAISALGMIFAPFAASILVSIYSMMSLWFVLGSGFILSALVLLVFAKEKYVPKKVRLAKAFEETYKSSKKGLKFTFTNKMILILLVGGIFSQLMIMGKEGWQPFLVSLTLPEHYLGFLYSILGAFILVTPFMSKIAKKYQLKNVISLTTLVSIVAMVLLLFITQTGYIYAAMVFILINSLKSFNTPLIQVYFHKFVPTRIRATVVSAGSMINQFISGIISIAGGFLLDLFGPRNVLAYGSLFGIFAIIAYLRLKD